MTTFDLLNLTRKKWVPDSVKKEDVLFSLVFWRDSTGFIVFGAHIAKYNLTNCQGIVIGFVQK